MGGMQPTLHITCSEELQKVWRSTLSAVNSQDTVFPFAVQQVGFLNIHKFNFLFWVSCIIPTSSSTVSTTTSLHFFLLCCILGSEFVGHVRTFHYSKLLVHNPLNLHVAFGLHNPLVSVHLIPHETTEVALVSSTIIFVSKSTSHSCWVICCSVCLLLHP